MDLLKGPGENSKEGRSSKWSSPHSGDLEPHHNLDLMCMTLFFLIYSKGRESSTRFLANKMHLVAK